MIIFNTQNYRTLHRSEPRGRGAWAFSLTACGSDCFFAHCMTYSEAKKFAKDKYPKETLFYVLG